jgi:peptidyl-prolyl cis-trans isomerase A (cyclophilin A)
MPAMNARPLLAALALAASGCVHAPSPAPRPAAGPAPSWPTDRPFTVRLVTTAGNIDCELDPVHAPIGVANFMHYALRGDYDQTIFHRAVPGFVVQGGGFTRSMVELPGDQPIANEWRNGLHNARGTLGWARDADPDSATREWYINLADNTKLDTPREVSGKAGYAVFGRVTSGMEIADAMTRGPLYALPDRDLQHIPADPVVVLRVEVPR